MSNPNVAYYQSGTGSRWTEDPPPPTALSRWNHSIQDLVSGSCLLAPDRANEMGRGENWYKVPWPGSPEDGQRLTVFVKSAFVKRTGYSSRHITEQDCSRPKQKAALKPGTIGAVVQTLLLLLRLLPKAP